MSVRVLVMGLPGAGKTTFSNSLQRQFSNLGKTYSYFNADEIRTKYNDWDFSKEGRLRQSIRMYELSINSNTDYVICDFVAPIEEMRQIFKPDWLIWIDTIDRGRYKDTNSLFQKPSVYDFRITEQNSEFWSKYVANRIVNNLRRPVFDYKKETVQMLGRWQPWHKGHRALFERAIKKTGQVCIMIRDCQGWNKSNPFDTTYVKEQIQKDLDPMYQGQYEIIVVPNIINITYGRDVGYLIEQEIFDDEIHAISATKIRKEMGLE